MTGIDIVKRNGTTITLQSVEAIKSVKVPMDSAVKSWVRLIAPCIPTKLEKSKLYLLFRYIAFIERPERKGRTKFNIDAYTPRPNHSRKLRFIAKGRTAIART
jgi:hypothetical protein